MHEARLSRSVPRLGRRGRTLHHAYAVMNHAPLSFTFTSEAVPLKIDT